MNTLGTSSMMTNVQTAVELANAVNKLSDSQIGDSAATVLGGCSQRSSELGVSGLASYVSGGHAIVILQARIGTMLK